MATVLHIPLEDYMAHVYRPDREYVDGEMRERNLGKYEHARIQALLARWFGNHEAGWGAQLATEQRIRVAKTRVRIPDVALVPRGPQPDVIADPPLFIVEILFTDDIYSDTQERAQDYSAMGVKTIWIIDPKTRTGRTCSGSEWIESSRLQAKGTPLHVNLPEIFNQLG